MNSLITINYDNEEQPTVSGRELYEALEVKTKYADWFSRMCEYGFEENEDYIRFSNLGSEKQRGGQNKIDHALTIPMAKEICMIQRSEKGKQFRQYFIEIENRWNTPEAVMARALQFANRRLEEIKESNNQLQLKIEQDKPLVEFAEQVSETSDLIDINEMAKLMKREDIDIGRNKLFAWLRKKNIVMANNLPYQEFINRGYFKVKEISKVTAFGTKVYTKTYVTGKGQIYISKKLRADIDAGAII